MSKQPLNRTSITTRHSYVTLSVMFGRSSKNTKKYNLTISRSGTKLSTNDFEVRGPVLDALHKAFSRIIELPAAGENYGHRMTLIQDIANDSADLDDLVKLLNEV